MTSSGDFHGRLILEIILHTRARALSLSFPYLFVLFNLVYLVLRNEVTNLMTGERKSKVVRLLFLTEHHAMKAYMGG
jgi:hypothetical protein